MTSKVPTDNEAPKLVVIKDLPIYPVERSPTDYKFSESPPLLLQKSEIKIQFTQRYESFAQKSDRWTRPCSRPKNSIISFNEYVQHEKTVLPKAAAITFGGMAGYILFFRRYGLKKYLSAIGVWSRCPHFAIPMKPST
uniref:MICOS complex subunit n=1 Tax=Ditylenchus dipsaci TaxID=166011 RepID=A0A915CW59_9BILA